MQVREAPNLLPPNPVVSPNLVLSPKLVLFPNPILSPNLTPLPNLVPSPNVLLSPHLILAPNAIVSPDLIPYPTPAKALPKGFCHPCLGTYGSDPRETPGVPGRVTGVFGKRVLDSAQAVLERTGMAVHG